MIKFAPSGKGVGIAIPALLSEENPASVEVMDVTADNVRPTDEFWNAVLAQSAGCRITLPAQEQDHA